MRWFGLDPVVAGRGKKMWRYLPRYSTNGREKRISPRRVKRRNLNIWKYLTFVKRLRFQRLKTDRCLYIAKNGREIVFLLLYVDDIIIAGKPGEKIEEIKTALEKRFHMKDLGSLHSFLGIVISRNSDGINLSQKSYLEKLLERFNMDNCKPIRTLIETKMETSQNT